MKTQLKMIYAVLIGLGLLTMVAMTVARNPEFDDNDFLKNLKTKLQVFLEGRSPERVYLHFDKPFYKPSETIWFQAYLRQEVDLKASQKSDILHVELINPKGNVEKEIQIIAKKGVASGDFELSEDAAGGIYKVRAYTNWQQNDEDNYIFEKEFQVQKVILPRLKMKLDFEKDAYGAGNRTTADLELISLKNQPLMNYDFNYVVSLKGKKILTQKANTNSEGKAKVSFELPKKLTTADGLLNISIQYNGQTESISRSIPIALNNIALEFFPEGGDMVEGLTTNVAFAAKDEFGKTSDVEGFVLDSKNKKVASFASFHKGTGAFKFLPKQNEKYTVKISKPTGISRSYELPEALPAGYILNVEKQNKEQIFLTVASTETEKLSLVAQVRGKIYFSAEVEAKKGENSVIIPTKDFPMGTSQITLFDQKGIERAERLVFVNQNQQLNIEIATDKEQYQPREQVNLSIKVSDERGIPMPAQLSLSVVDDKLISFADDKSSTILSSLLLESDLTGKVEEPRFYFDPKEEKATQALDYLLMTQGWRKFKWEQVIDNQYLTVKFNPEKAIIAGHVIDQRSNKGASKVKVEIPQLNIKTETDNNGDFKFENIEFYEAITLTFSHQELGQQSRTLYAFDQNINISMNNFRYRKQMLRNMAMGAGNPQPVVDKNNDAVDANWIEPEVEKAALREEIFELPKEEGEVLMVDAVVEVIAKDEQVAVERMVVAEELNAKIILDQDDFFGEEDEIEIMEDLIIQEEGEVNYYRARVFPKMEYSKKNETRSDFRSTIFWNGNVVVDRKGKATISFLNSDEVTSFRITTEGIGTDGSVGRAEHTYHTELPLSMDVKMPITMSMGDKISIPLILTNNTNQNLNGKLKIKTPEAWKIISKVSDNQVVKAGESKAIYLDYEVLNIAGKAKFAVDFDAGNGLKDSFTQDVNISAKGFPYEISASGQELEQTFSFEIVNPVEGTIHASVKAYPSSLSDMLSGIESILREPYGCFEQTSSSTYPNIMVLDYLKENEFNNPKVYARANDLLEKGYKRLTSYETADKGYEWFGANPPHEALSAYGLMEFKDMQKVSSIVDDKMVQRTADWLLSRKDSEGGFLKNPRALDSFGSADKDITDAYIVYSLSEAGIQDIGKEVDAAFVNANKTQDPYLLALAANTLYNRKDNKRGNKMMADLLKVQAKDGSWTGKRHSITRSTGKGLQIETTSLAVLAMLKADKKSPKEIDNAVKFVIASRSGAGGFGNTQSTVLALKSLTQYAQYAKRTDEAGTIEVYVDNKKVSTMQYEAGRQEEITLEGLEAHLSKGKHKIKVKYVGVKNPLPYTMNVNWSTNMPNSNEECQLDLSTKLANKSIKMGETVRLKTILTNKTAEGLPMSMAIVGIPAGLSAQPWQLKELQEKHKIDFYEVTDNSVVFYFRQMKPSEIRNINLDLKAEVVGEYEAPASSAYLYYTNEFKHWVKAERITVKK